MTDLRAIQEAATAGPWVAQTLDSNRIPSTWMVSTEDDSETWEPIAECAFGDSELRIAGNSDFIATFDPIMVGKLLDDGDRLAKALLRAEMWLDGNVPERLQAEFKLARREISDALKQHRALEEQP